MRYSRIDNALFKRNRWDFMQRMEPRSVAVFNSNDIMPTSADGTMPFKQATDIFYLSGIDQEESVLMLCPDHPDERLREVLFVRETSELIAKWEGEKLTQEQATEVSGVTTVYWEQEFKKVFATVVNECDHIYLNSNEHTRATVEVETRDARFLKWCMEKYPVHTYRRSAPILHGLRAVKHDIEIAIMRKAMDITAKGFDRVLRFTEPGVWEYEIEAELSHEFLRSRANGFAYTPIIASGRNACILHYIENNCQCKDGEVILMDAACEYANYDSDLTRAFPVSGRFTQRQKDVYNAVLRVQKAGIDMMRPGTLLRDYEKEIARLMESELISLGLISRHDVEKQDPKNPAYRRYYYHNTSHFLGLDTHDVAYFSRPLQAGNVLTVEPGIYIKEEGLGIRIEDNILVTENGPVNLMSHIPKEVDEIEAIMNS
jgi:Xaa-Pro aminopeptidase